MIDTRTTVWIATITTLLATAAPSRAQSSDRDSSASLGELVREARRNHPAVTAARETRAALAEVPSQVGSLPDPVFTTGIQNLRIDDFTLDGHPMTGTIIGLSQGLPFPGKLSRRRRAAERLADVAAERILAVDVAIELRVRERYWALHYAERAEALVTENERALDMLTDVVHARYSVGQGAQQDALQAEVAHSRLRARLHEVAEATRSARRALNAAVGRAPNQSLAPTRAPGPAPTLLDVAHLLANARKHNPDLRVADAAVTAAAAAVDSAHRDRLPDFAVGLGYRLRAAAPGDASNGADMISFTVSMTLPVWAGSKQNARTRQARRELSARRAQTASLALDIADAVARTRDEIDRLSAQIELYRTEVVPEADQALDASVADYGVGRVEFVSVLQNWRAQLDVKLELEHLLTQRAARLARLRALCGGAVEKLP